MKKEPVHIQSLMRALDILEVVSDSKEPIRATEIPRLSGLGVATAHNIIRTLYARDYLAQNNKGRYMLRALCLQLKSNCEDYFSEIRAASKAVIEELSKEEAEEVMRIVKPYDGGVGHNVASCLCGRACKAECFIYLSENGKLKRKFNNPFRTEKRWRINSK